MIGIVGGVGPYAGVDLLRKLLDNTLANSDQDKHKNKLKCQKEIIPDVNL